MLPMFFRRKDGEPLDKQLSVSRRFLPFVLGPATDSWLLWEEKIKMEPALAFIERWNASHPAEEKISLHHLLLRACAKAYMSHMRMNKFVSGNRYYKRNGVYISFSAKKEMSESAGLLIFKRRFEEGETMEAVVRDLRSMLDKDRKEKVSGQEKETNIYMLLPRFVLSGMFKLWKVLDYFNLLPHSMIESNPMYAGMFISNLGSLGMDSGWHHLYTFGNISLFGVLGAPMDTPVVEDGQVVVRKVASLKWTFDERIEDGYNAGRAAATVTRLMENPEELL